MSTPNNNPKTTPAPRPATGTGLLGKVGAKAGGSIRSLAEPRELTRYSSDQPEQVVRSKEVPTPTIDSND